MGLRLRLFLMLFIPLILLAGLYGFVRIRQEAARVLDAERRDAAATSRAVQVAVENALRDRQVSDIGRLVSGMVRDHAQIDRVSLFNRSLEPLISEPSVALDPAARARLGHVLRTGRAEARFVGSDAYLYAVPLAGGRGEPQGILEIAFRSGVRARVRDATQDIVVSVAALAAVLAIFAAIVLQRQLLRPLSLLTGSIRALGEGRPGPPLPVSRRDEVGAVAAAFNRMVEQLDAARQRILAENERNLELEQQLRQAATLAVAGRLASGIAHEVGTPLNIISGRTEILLRSLPPDDPGRADLEVIVGQIDRISAIIRSLLDTVRAHKPAIQPVAPAPLVERLLALLRPMARRRGVSLAAELPAPLPEAAADPGQLQQVLLNLLMNALEATPAGGPITVSAAPRDHDGRAGVALTVADTGPGIAPEALGRVFEPFYTTKPPGQGTGLGLAICRDIVREHGGTLTVQNRPGGGAAFTVWLPQQAIAP
jgi:signal transduction histidine kinase